MQSINTTTYTIIYFAATKIRTEHHSAMKRTTTGIHSIIKQANTPFLSSFVSWLPEWLSLFDTLHNAHLEQRRGIIQCAKCFSYCTIHTYISKHFSQSVHCRHHVSLYLTSAQQRCCYCLLLRKSCEYSGEC